MKKYIEKLLSASRASACGVGFRNVLLFLLTACAAGLPVATHAYQNMGGDRILLLNNDSRSDVQGRIEGQGYYDTNTTAGVSYWTHTPEGDNRPTQTRSLLHGTEHVLYGPTGEAWWHLVDCRTGSVALNMLASRNSIPYSKYAQSSVPPATTVKVDGVTSPVVSNGVNACVFMRNSRNSAVYSPYYAEGIGTIYFDTVNSFPSSDDIVKVEIATNLTEEATTWGDVSFEEVHKKIDFSRWDDYYNWQTLPLTVLEVNSGTVSNTFVNLEQLEMAVTDKGNKHYYRVRTQLNYYGPIRFRIKRVTESTTGVDTAYLTAIDNVIASYPPMTIKLDRVGDDYDQSLTGTSVIGNIGDFDKPFLNYSDKSVNTHVNFSWVTNFQNTTLNLRLTGPKFTYRWRYLDQKVNPWQTVDLKTNANVTASALVEYMKYPQNTQLVSVVGIPLSDGVGDLEYFYSANVSAPFYQIRDYANDSGTIFGRIIGTTKVWSEAITSVTNRFDVPSDFKTPALGSDYFTRVREGASDYKWVKLCTSVTTNGQAGVKKEDVRMELVGDHTWRYHYYVPTNMVGEVFSFHFQGEEIFTNAWVAGYHSRTNTWYCDLKELPYIPYTSAAGLGYHNDISCTLDPAATHLMIEFNDELLSFSISHASYQNFNAWTDANVGYVGHTNWNGEGAVGVSDQKQKYVLEMTADNRWETSDFTSEYWKESFNTTDYATYPFDKNFDEHATPNGWTAGHGFFVHSQRGQSEMALQLQGRGEGWIGMENFTDDIMPYGIDKVRFRARIAQTPRFDDFAWFMDGIAFTNYAFAARLAMGHGADALGNPSDISPGTPSVSLVGYYRPSVGCYEYRITRSGQYQLCAALYKWRPDTTGMTATLLASNAVSITSEPSYAVPGVNQSKIINLGNYLVPGKASSDAVLAGSYAYLYIKKESTGVSLRGCLSKSRNLSTMADDKANIITLVSCSDTQDALSKGTFGVGSTDCSATFSAMARHRLDGSTNIVWTAVPYTDATGFGYMKGTQDDWAYFSNRWVWDSSGTSDFADSNIKAVMATNQTIKLEFKTSGSSDGWQPSGYEQIISSWSTNRYDFTPRVSPSYQVRLRAGGNTWDDLRTDLVVDDIEVTSWQAENYPDLAYYNGQSAQWVYTQGVVTNRSGSLALTFQPCRGINTKAMSLRTPFLANGLSMFSFSYANADANAKLLLQVCTNILYVGSVSESLTCYPPSNYNWTTITNWDFSKMTATERSSGTFTYYMSLRAPIKGLIRVAVDPSVIQYCLDNEGKASRKVDYGQITITDAFCYDEPALDMRSWYAWNFHTAGWNTADKRFAYLFDSPDGMSGSLNFSALDSDNNTTLAATQGIGLSDRSDIPAYAANNSFIQCPPMTNGIGSVSFRARTFETNATRKSSWVTLYGSYEPDDDQVVSPESWKRICDFEVTNTTYHTFEWKTTDDSSQYHAIRLEVANSRHGRSAASSADSWETPKTTDPLQRVFIDEIAVGEPIQPRIVFRNVRPFRSGITDIPPNVVSNVTDLSEQPLFGESWGLQCTIEPQQMGDQLDEDSIKVYAIFKRGISPWGYENWSNSVTSVRLDRIPGTLTFRSSYNTPASIISPIDTPTSTYPDNVWQYYLWCEFKDTAGNQHRHGLDSVDWTVPSWYYGITDLNKQFASQGFAGYTILDTISPKRAWINEVNLCDTGDFTNQDGEKQFIEIAVPRGADITAWAINVMGSSLNKGTLATYGYDTAMITPSPKSGVQLGIDWTNDYTVVALRSPAAREAGTVANADGTWSTMDSATCNKLNMSGKSALYNYECYGLELVRPSGVIEHQIIIQGTNYYAGTDWEAYGSGTNLLAEALAADGSDAQWFFAGIDATPSTLGVFKSHGEDSSCWTNILVSTPAELNKFEDGTRQVIDPNWFLQPNGTNVWVYATVLGNHIHQSIGSKTNNSEVFIIRKGASTNIVYTADKWWALGEVTTNGQAVAAAKGRADRADNHTWTLDLKDIESTLTVYANEQAGTLVTGVGLDATDPYFPAIMDWLGNMDDSTGLYMAKHIPLSGDLSQAQDLDIKGMYWLDINPTEPNWAIVAGMGSIGGTDAAPITQVISDAGYGRAYTNVRVKVTMMITNLTTDTSSPYYGTAGARAPDHLNGLEPGSSSLNYDVGSPAWTSVTFKVCGALQRSDAPDVAKSYYPLRWFVFTPGSFDENFQATIDLWDPRSSNSPGWFYGWSDYPTVPIYYKFKFDGDPAWYDTAEPLKADSTYK